MTIARIKWQPCWNIAQRSQSQQELLEAVAESDDFEAIDEVDFSTRDGGGNIPVASNERLRSPSRIRDTFANPNPRGSRFSSGGTDGVFYVANDLDTAIAETKHHREEFMRMTVQPPGTLLDMQVYMIDLDGQFYDVRGQRERAPLIYHEDDYRHAQTLATRLRRAGSKGIVYDSVRGQGGECVAAFHPDVLSNERQERCLRYVWNGKSIKVNKDSGETE